MRKGLLTLRKGLITSNAQAVNSGSRRIKDAIIWLADVNTSFVSDVELNMALAHVMKLNLIMGVVNMIKNKNKIKIKIKKWGKAWRKWWSKKDNERFK